MKQITLFLALAVATVLPANSLERDATVYATPDPTAPVIGSLPKGTSPELAAAGAPEGWLAVLVPGPQDVYVRNTDVGKNLDIKPGSSLYVAPDTSAPTVGRMEAGDKAELKGLRGDWTLYSYEDPLTGFIKLATPNAPAPATTERGPITGATVAPRASASDIAATGVPRFVEGRFTATRGFLGFRHPYNFQLVDKNGVRIAYLDISRLLLTENVQNFEDRLVIVYGTASRLEDKRRKGVVMEVESLHLK
jgi:hypothetical protein